MPYITPLLTPASNRCWRLSIPRDGRILAAILGQLLELTEAVNWEEEGGITVDETTALMQTMFDKFSIGSYCMIGSLIHYVTLSPPNGVLPCDGVQYARVDYPDLYADLPPSLIIDADNFITPTIEDVFMIASGASYPDESSGGEAENTLTVNQMPKHGHTSPPHDHAESGATPNTVVVNAGAPVPTSLPLATTTGPATVTIDDAGNDEAHNNMPPYVAYSVGIVAL